MLTVGLILSGIIGVCGAIVWLASKISVAGVVDDAYKAKQVENDVAGASDARIKQLRRKWQKN